MNIVDIIAKKMDKQILTKYEIRFFINGFNSGEIKESHAAALIMAMCINGITDEEMIDIAIEMSKTQELLDVSALGNNLVNIHFSNGVDDKISLILMTLMATFEIPVARICSNTECVSGGIINKLKSIPKLNLKMDTQEFIENIQDIYMCYKEDDSDIPSINSKIIKLINEIACSNNLQLLAASIMSKEISKGVNNVVVHIPVGNASFVKKEVDARKLAEKIIKIGKAIEKQIVCVITDMSQPIGYSIGNSLEMIETIEALKGKMQEDIKQIVLELGAQIIKLYKKDCNLDDSKVKMIANLENNKAFDKFIELVENQCGNISYVQNIENFKTAEYIIPVTIEKIGFVKKIDTAKLQSLSYELGRSTVGQQDIIDNKVGIIVTKKIGDRIEEGDIIGFIHTNVVENEEKFIEILKNCYEISDTYLFKPKIILGIME